jgi:Zn-dependent peptidase ImmA (M78 family)
LKLRTEAYYRHVAEDALALVGVTEPPVPIGDVVASLCVPVRLVNLPPFFTAATIYEDGMPVMMVNATRPEIDRRRAMAHMLGHVLLLLDDDSYAFPRAGLDHNSADSVARELIMPAGLVVDQARLWFNDYRYLSRLFGVPEGTMLERMRELHLVKNQGIMWDY